MRSALLWLSFALVPLLGCGEDPKHDDTSEGDTDTDTDADGDTDADSDTDADTDTGKPPEPGIFIFRFMGPLEDLGFGLLPTTADATTFEAMEQGAVISEETLEIEIPTPESAELTVFDPAEPKVTGKVWLPATFHDADGSGELEVDSDYYTSLGEAALVYLEGPMGETLQAAGFRPGWNARNFLPGEGIDYAQPLDPNDLVLRQNIDPTPSLRLEGSYDLATDSSLINLMVTAPEDLVDGKTLTVMDRPISEKDGAWGQTLNNGPPPAHAGLRDLDEDASVEAIYAYIAGDSGTFESLDSIQGMACYKDQSLLPVYLPPAVQPAVALRYLSKDLKTGWSLYLGDTEPPLEPASTEVAMNASISASCYQAR